MVSAFLGSTEAVVVTPFVERFAWLPSEILDLAKDIRADAHLLKLHLVAGERACLVREDVVQLAEVLDNAHVFDVGALASRVAKHLHVVFDEPSYEKLYHLSRHEE